MKFICPFCAKTHVLTELRNIVCPCKANAKLYILFGYWLNRTDGIRVDLDFQTRYELNKYIGKLLDGDEK